MDGINEGRRGLFLTNLEVAEQIFSVPVEQREALLLKLTAQKKAEYLGHTTKTGPELAIDCIKQGVNAKSFCNNKTPLTVTKKSDKLLVKKKPPV